MRPFATLLLLSLARWAFGQALPSLPELPSPSPARSPSPLPSALSEIVNSTPSPISSPSPITPTAVPPGISSSPQGSKPSPSPQSIGASSTPRPSLAPSVGASLSPSPSPSPEQAFLYEDGECIRDESRPRPVLGKSQLRYAVSVLLSAAAVGLATLFYGLAADWEPDIDHSALRVICIVIARLLTIGAVKTSAALVAAITKASPDDGALDASGAFLTWGTAIYTRLYYEGFKMTMAVLEFTDNSCVWDDKLRSFFSVRRVKRKVLVLDADDPVENEKEALRTDEEGEEYIYIEGKLSLSQRLLGGNMERKLFLITTLFYFASEIAVLTANVLDLVGAFVQNADHINFFSSDVEGGGQCHITRKDFPIIGGLLFLQGVYVLTQQPSLVPLLTVSAFCPQCDKFPAINKVLNKLRWIAGVILILWVVSLLTLPLFSKPLQPFFTVGDISLFWYVMIAPPQYRSVSYVITATYACLAAVVGIIIIYGISKSQRKEVDEESPSSSGKGEAQ